MVQNFNWEIINIRRTNKLTAILGLQQYSPKVASGVVCFIIYIFNMYH
jgi:hypothetical protein